MKKNGFTRANFSLNSKNLSGFTLLELIIVIAILGSLVALASGNFMTSLKRGRDAKLKGEMQALKLALQLYNNDYGVYPANTASPNFKINGCGTNGTTTCPVATCTTVDFGAGNATCTSVVYMSKLPASYTANSMLYHRISSGADFCLRVPLEITTDGDIAKSKARCTNKCTGVTFGTNDYVVCSE